MDHQYSPKTQIIVASQVIVKLDPVLQGLHGCVGDAQWRIILIAQSGFLLGCGGHAVTISV